MQERRSCNRWRIERQVKIRFAGAESDCLCRLKDINCKGMRLCLPFKLKSDYPLKFSLVLADDCCLGIIEGWIVWHKTADDVNTCGFLFSQINERDKENVYQFVRRHYPDRIAQQWWEGTGIEHSEGGEVMSEAKQEDKRVFARFKVKLPLRFVRLDSNVEGRAYTEDISAKGIGLVADVALKSHSPLEIWLDIPDGGEPLYTRAEVAWSTETGADNYRTGLNLEKADFMGLARILRVAQ